MVMCVMETNRIYSDIYKDNVTDLRELKLNKLIAKLSTLIHLGLPTVSWCNAGHFPKRLTRVIGSNDNAHVIRTN